MVLLETFRLVFYLVSKFPVKTTNKRELSMLNNILSQISYVCVQHIYYIISLFYRQCIKNKCLILILDQC